MRVLGAHQSRSATGRPAGIVCYCCCCRLARPRWMVMQEATLRPCVSSIDQFDRFRNTLFLKTLPLPTVYHQTQRDKFPSQLTRFYVRPSTTTTTNHSLCHLIVLNSARLLPPSSPPRCCKTHPSKVPRERDWVTQRVQASRRPITGRLWQLISLARRPKILVA